MEARGSVHGRTYTYIIKSRLVVSFCGVADRERKHLGKKAFGIRGTRAPGQRIDRAFLGRLAFGPNPFGVPGRRIDQAFLGLVAFGLSPTGALGLGRLAKGTEPRPIVPSMPPLFLPGRKIIPGWKNRNKLDRHIIGNNRPSLLLNFQRKFWNFFEIALDAIGSFELILRFRGSYKRLVGE